MLLHVLDIDLRNTGRKTEPDEQSVQIVEHRRQVFGRGDEAVQGVFVQHRYIIQGHLADEQHRQQFRHAFQGRCANEVDQFDKAFYIG